MATKIALSNAPHEKPTLKLKSRIKRPKQALSESAVPKTKPAPAPKVKPEPKKARRVIGKPIQKGQVLNPKGRPVGARQRLTEGFITALSSDFERHGVRTIAAMREEKPDVYVRIVADLTPKDVNLNHNATDAFVDLWKALFAKEGDE